MCELYDLFLAHFFQHLNAYVEAAIASLEINISDASDITDLFKRDLELGMSEKFMRIIDKNYSVRTAPTLLLLDTKVPCQPTGEEKGIFYSMDVGGSNIRMTQVKVQNGAVLTNGHTIDVPENMMWPMTTCYTLFNMLARVAKDFLVRVDDIEHRVKDGSVIPGAHTNMGLTFSFPVEQESISSAVLNRWTKGWQTGRFSSDPVEGRDVVEELNAALDRQQVPLRVTACVNDTVAVQLTQTYISKAADDYPCTIGLVLGTGFNLSFFDAHSGKYVNTEAGNFDKLPFSEFDIALDRDDTDVGVNRMEKMVSGKYIPILVRRVCDAIFRRASLRNLLPDEFDAAYVNHITTLKKDELLKYFFPETLKSEATPVQHWQGWIIWTVCVTVMKRAGNLIGALLVGLYEDVGYERITVGVDGSVHEKCVILQEALDDTVRKLLHGKEHGIKILNNKNSSASGAAICAAIVDHVNNL